MSKIQLCSIAAMSENNVIGKDGDIPWHISQDFRYFKRSTMGKPMIMGRKCFESLPGILPGRPHIVVSRSAFANTTPNSFGPANEHESESRPIHSGLYYAESIGEGIDLGQKIARQCDADQIFIAGGGEIYKQTMGLIDRLYLTLIHRNYEGDTFFPKFDWDDWHILSEERHEGDPAFTFFVLEKPKPQ